MHYSCSKTRGYLNACLGHFLEERSVLFPAKRMGDMVLNKSLIHQNNTDQVFLEMLAVVNLARLPFFVDILLDLVRL
jgi:hypothetical protein